MPKIEMAGIGNAESNFASRTHRPSRSFNMYTHCMYLGDSAED